MGLVAGGSVGGSFRGWRWVLDGCELEVSEKNAWVWGGMISLRKRSGNEPSDLIWYCCQDEVIIGGSARYIGFILG